MSTSAPRVVCAMPCRTVPNFRAFKALQIAAAKHGAPIDTPAREPRERNRNNCVAQFLGHGDKFTHLLFVDDDTAIPPDAIERLLAVDKPFVTGIQPLYLAFDGVDHMVANVMQFPTETDRTPHWPDWLTFEPDQDPFPVFHCGFGCVLLERRVLESTGFPWFKEDYGDVQGRNNITEDIWFCDHVRRAGIDIWCRPDLICSHYKTVDLLDIVPRSRVNWSPTESNGQPWRYRSIRGWLPNDAQRLIAGVVKGAPPGALMVELGTFHGRSACYVGELIKASGRDDIRFVTVDLFDGCKVVPGEARKDMRNQFEANLLRAGVRDYVDTIVADSAESAAQFHDGTVDFLYIDAGHAYEDVIRDIDAWLPKLKHDGIIAGDDYSPKFEGVIKAVDEKFPEAEINGMTWAVRLGVEAACETVA